MDDELDPNAPYKPTKSIFDYLPSLTGPKGDPMAGLYQSQDVPRSRANIVDPALEALHNKLGQPLSADQKLDLASKAKIDMQRSTSSPKGVQHGDASWQSDMFDPSTNRLAASQDPLSGYAGRTPQIGNSGSHFRTGPAATAPESLNSFHSSDDPWSENGTAGQMESDIAAHDLINRKYNLAKQQIDQDYNSRYPDTTRQAMVNADMDAKLAASKMLAKDPLAIDKAKAAMDMGQKLGVYQGERNIDREEIIRRGLENDAALKAEDDDYRKTKAQMGAQFSGDELVKRLAALDADHAAQIDKINNAHGFGDKSKNDAFVGLGKK